MRIAIASKGTELNSQVCLTAGRSPYYLIFDNNDLVKTLKNPFAVGGGGAGSGVIQMLFNEHVSIIVSGKFGDTMLRSINEKSMEGIEMKEKTVAQALKLVIDND